MTAEIARAHNGIATPLYFDRQVVRADDLTLDRSSHDAELARIRGFLHGWGVVSGLVPAVTTAGVPRLTVSPGYGVTPPGEEVYLAEPVVVDGDIAALVRKHCGPGAPGCELTPAGAGREIEDADVIAWLVARPVRTPSAPRAGVPAGCAHPASALSPTRACHGVSLELHCTAPLPQDDCLVLARLVAGPAAVTVDLAARHPLWPVSVLQDWVVAHAPRFIPDVVPSASWAGQFTGGPNRELLAWTAADQDYLLGQIAGERLSFAYAGNTSPFGGGERVSPTWTGNFTGSRRTELLFWHPPDGNFWLGRFTGTHLHYSLAGNVSAAASAVARWTGAFTGAGRTELLSWSPGNQNFSLGRFTGNQLGWTKAGNLGGIDNADRIWTGNFTGSAATELLLWGANDRNYWLLRFPGGQLAWAPAGNTDRFAGAERVSPSWTGAFTGAGGTELLFWYPGDHNYWLGRFHAGQIDYTFAGNTDGFGGAEAVSPVWAGNFTGAGKTELLFWYPGDQNYWLGRFTGDQLGWTHAGNTSTLGRAEDSGLFWVGDFGGTGRDQLLFYAPAERTWRLGDFAGGRLTYTVVGEAG
ncbi:hypothetical protein AB0J83_44190 [Actinoplanes sp. NPDC049596]|uniref:hypothetical protein n=1 Tax=unclassified Actinoplanes TaxID=2626549 RepID=UPI00343B0176